MGVYYYIVNRTLRQKVKEHFGKWGEFNFHQMVQYLCEDLDDWSLDHDIWAIGDDGDAVKYYPKGELSDEEVRVAMEEYEEV